MLDDGEFTVSFKLLLQLIALPVGAILLSAVVKAVIKVLFSFSWSMADVTVVVNEYLVAASKLIGFWKV